MAGVKKVVPVGDSGVAVIADTYWHARKAMDALPIVWDPGENAKVSSATIADFLKTGLDAEQASSPTSRAMPRLRSPAPRQVRGGLQLSLPQPRHHGADERHRALYGGQVRGLGADAERRSGAGGDSEESGLPVAKCDMHKTFLGGGFGRRGRVDYVRQVVNIAKQMPGTPIKLIWSREEDMTHCAYHPVTQCKLSAGIDADGNVTSFHMRISGQSIAASLAPERMENGMDPIVFQGLTPNSPEGNFGYQIPNILIDHAMRNPHILAGFWRGVNVNHNAIYTECFIDELAHELKQDPLAFRLKMLKPKNAAVLKAVAEKAGWGTPAPAGVFRGLSQYHGYGTYCAACAEVSVGPDGMLKIHRIVAATNPGTPSTRRRSSGRWPARSCTASPRSSTASAR